MKKKILIGLGILLGLIVIGFSVNKVLNLDVSSDEIKFKKEYESINGTKWESDGYSGEYLTIDLPRNNLMKYATDETIVDLVTSGTKVIYFGNAKCNWCRSAVPVLIEAAKDYGLQEIYYYDFFSLRSAYEEGTDQRLVDIYQSLMNEIGDLITTTFDEESNTAGEKRLSAPSVVTVSTGKVVDLHLKTVDSHTNYNKDLTSEQKKELKTIYLNMFKELVYICDEGC